MAFKWYGSLGILLIVLVQLNFLFEIEPFASYFFIPLWIGFILMIDAFNFQLSKKSYLMTDRKRFFYLFALSATIWWVFELINLQVGNWPYNSLDSSLVLLTMLKKTLYFSTVIPVIFEIANLFKSLHLFDHTKLKKSHKLSKDSIYLIFGLGILSLMLPMIWPKLFSPLVWLSFFLLFDSMNYLHKEPSLIKHLEDKQLLVPLTLLVAGLIYGFLVEFWNILGVLNWQYALPQVSFFKILNGSFLGYVGYIPFAWSLYSAYHFVNTLFKTRGKDIL